MLYLGMKKLKVYFHKPQLIQESECMFLFCDCLLNKGDYSELHHGDEIIEVINKHIKLITVV